MPGPTGGKFPASFKKKENVAFKQKYAKKKKENGMKWLRSIKFL